MKTSKLDVIDYYGNEVHKSNLTSLDRKKYLLGKKKDSFYQKYQIYCPFTTISSREEQEKWDRFLYKKKNGDTLTIDEYNMVLKTMRTIEGVENVLDEISNLLYDVDFNEDTYFILMNFYFNCGFVSRGKDFFKALSK